ncbi:MAG: hypothetical protein PWP03_380 [Candidatus Woesearchaeota archaeon]|nr:hypothetical protein [Candidatus Woesearchaeota archaeon]MDN5327742.1 hypothetical protein [Candidatus Woesearchaeota archaeon]
MKRNKNKKNLESRINSTKIFLRYVGLPLVIGGVAIASFFYSYPYKSLKVPLHKQQVSGPVIKYSIEEQRNKDETGYNTYYAIWIKDKETDEIYKIGLYDNDWNSNIYSKRGLDEVLSQGTGVELEYSGEVNEIKIARKNPISKYVIKKHDWPEKYIPLYYAKPEE